MTFPSVSTVIGYAAGYKRLKKYKNNNNTTKLLQKNHNVPVVHGEWFQRKPYDEL